MFAHNRRLQYTVRVTECNPGLANLLLEQFGGPQGELAAATRYFTQFLAEDDLRLRSDPDADPLTGAMLGTGAAPDGNGLAELGLGSA